MCIRLKSCCCGASLEKGCLYIAYVGIGFGIFGAIGEVAQFDFVGAIGSLFAVAINYMLLYGVSHIIVLVLQDVDLLLVCVSRNLHDLLISWKGAVAFKNIKFH